MQSARIIPTRMGTRISHFRRSAPREDHPHAYGDKSLRTLKTARLRGSSPRVWGQGISGNMNAEIKRDHPHAYGDKFLPTVATLSTKGSSPRVWGQVPRPLGKVKKASIIPTRMGTSPRQIQTSEFGADHPHAYGDKIAYILHACKVMGSSPRVWGQDSVYSPCV